MNTCPHCQADLQGAPIPAENFVHLEDCPLPEGTKRFPGRCFCLPYGDYPENERFFGREILIEIPEIYDGGLFYMCPDCSGRWHRWPEDHHLYEKADPYVRGIKE